MPSSVDPEKPTDLDLHFLSIQGISGFSRTGLTCTLFIIVHLFTVPFGVIGRICSVIHCDSSWISSLNTLVMLNPDILCLCKQCRSRSVGFWRSQLIWLCTVCHLLCEFIATIQIKQSDWLKIRSGCGILIYSAWQGLTGWQRVTVSYEALAPDKALFFQPKSTDILNCPQKCICCGYSLESPHWGTSNEYPQYVFMDK